MRFKDFRLRIKFILVLGMILVFYVASSLIALNGIKTVTQDAEAIIHRDNTVSYFRKIHEMHMTWLLDVYNNILNNRTPSEGIITNGNNCYFGKWYNSSERKDLQEKYPSVKQFLMQMAEPHEKLHESVHTLDMLLAEGKSMNDPEVISFYNNTLIRNSNSLGKLFDKVEDTLMNSTISDTDMMNDARRSYLWVSIIIIVTALTATVLTYILVYGINKPLYRTVVFAKKIELGNLTATIDVNQKDEVGRLVNSIRKMTDKLKQTLGNVLKAAGNVTDASVQLSSTSQEISQASSEQASSVEEVSSSIEEMTSNIEQNTENAQKTEKIAKEVAEKVVEGSEKVAATAEAMRQIAEKISIIGEIAFQTNILALNAAVEAARAGEHGKGFGVVAAEVGKLAERSKLAAAEIDEISKSSVMKADEANEIMEAIVPEIQNTSKYVQEITASSLEQNSGAQQINSAIQQLSDITQQNAASAEEMATSSEELATQAERLQDIVSFFRVGINVESREKAREKEVKKDSKLLSAKSSGEKGINIKLDENPDLDDEFERF